MMLAEVKLLMEDKISGDREKGEETPTTKTKCVPRWGRLCTLRLGAGSRLKSFGARGVASRSALFLAAGSDAVGLPPLRLPACSKRRMRMSRGSATRTRRWRLRSPYESAHNQP